MSAKKATRTAAGRIGSAVGSTAASALVGTREAIRRNPTANTVYRVGVGVVGGGTVALGVVLIPLPGPGALVALGGLGILASEFEGARKARTAAGSAARRIAAAARELRRPHPEAAERPSPSSDRAV